MLRCVAAEWGETMPATVALIGTLDTKGVEIAYVRDRLSDPSGRALLRDRFMESQLHAQSDPWAERADGADAHEFRALATVE